MTDDIKSRFESKFRVTPSCWIWTAYEETTGYGKFSIKRRMKGAHRISYEIYVGSIPAGMQVLHRCDNRICVNPDHLFLGTNSDNMADKVSKGRQTRGTRTSGAKLSEIQVLEIRADRRPQTEIAKAYGIVQSAVWNIKNLKRWKHVPASGENHE